MVDVELRKGLDLFTEQSIAFQVADQSLLFIKDLNYFEELVEVYVFDERTYFESALAGVRLVEDVAEDIKAVAQIGLVSRELVHVTFKLTIDLEKHSLELKKLYEVFGCHIVNKEALELRKLVRMRVKISAHPHF
jgi:hypothetical protein